MGFGIILGSATDSYQRARKADDAHDLRKGQAVHLYRMFKEDCRYA